MSSRIVKVFVSATTQDLRTCREIVKSVLLDHDIHPRTQEHFPPDYRELTEYLRSEIASCDAVICLVGFVYGAAPGGIGNPPLSYTQIEYDIARKLDKPVYVFLTKQTHVPDGPSSDSPQQTQWQNQHRERLLSAHKCEWFDGTEQLKWRVAEAIPQLRDLAGYRPMHYLHPPKPPSYFAGRVEELAQLRAALSATVPSVIVVVGMGGQGKTTLVYQAIREIKSFPFATGFWSTAYRDGLTFDMFLDKVLGYLLGGKFDKRELPEVRARASRLIGLLQERPVLLVIDGVERWLRGWNRGAADPQVAETSEERIGVSDGLDDFLAEASGLENGTHLVLTTRALPAVLDHARRAIIPMREEIGKDLSLEGLTPDASRLLLQSLGVRGEQDELLAVAERYGHHPLALTVLGGLVCKKFGGSIGKSGLGVSAAERGAGGSSVAVRQRAPIDILDPRRELFRLFEETQRNLPGGAVAIRIMVTAAHCLENPPLALLATVLRDEAAEDDLLEHVVTLGDWHLVDWNGETEVVALHPLLKQFFAGQAEPPESAVIHRRIADWYEAQPVPDAPRTLEHIKHRFLAVKHALLAGDVARGKQLVFATVTPTYSFVEWLAAFGHFLTGIDLLRELAEASDGKVRAELLVARSVLARQLGHLVDATTDLDQAIVILDKLEDEEGVALAGALCNRGNVFRQRSLYEKSLADYRRSAGILDRLPIGDTSAQLHLATLLVNRGNLLRELARTREAIQDYTAAIDIHRHLFEPSRQVVDSELALALSNRGNARADLNQNDLALEDYAAGLGIYACLIELGQSEFQPQLAHLHVLRGTVLQAQGEHAGSLRALDAGVRVMKELVSSGRNDLEPSLALALMNRSLTLLRLSRHDEALEDSGTAITAYRRLVKAGREDLRGFQAHSLLSGALIRYELGDSAGASECLAEGRRIALPMVRRSEREMLIVYVRYLTLIATAIATQDPTQSVALLNEALDEVEPAADDKQTFEALAAPIYALLGPLQSVEPILRAHGLDENRYTHVRKLVCDALE